MRAGSLRHQITIEKQSTTRDSYGEIGGAWTSGLNTWASIEPLRGLEYFNAQQIQAGVTHEIRMRNLTMIGTTGISSKHRIKFGSRYFNITSVINPSEQKSMGLILMCEEAV